MRGFREAGALWLVAWLSVMPLVHVHPEADHRHGLPGHVHGGTFHTILSPELPCASRAPIPQDGPPLLSAAAPVARLLFGGGVHLGDHPTIGFSLLTAEAKPLLVQQGIAASVDSREGFHAPWQARSVFDLLLEPPQWFSSTSSLSRAPPRHVPV